MEPKFIEMAKTIFNSIDHYRESGRDDKFNIDSIAEYLQRQFLLQQTDCYTMLPLSEQFNVWIKETKRNGGVLIGSSIREFFKWVEDRNIRVFSGNIV